MRFCFSSPTLRQQQWLVTGLVLAAFGGTILTGCGGGGSTPSTNGTSTNGSTNGSTNNGSSNNGSSNSNGGTTTDPAGAVADVAQGQTQLNTLITANVDPTSASLAALTQTFASAYTKDPNNNQAAMGLGIGTIAEAAQQVVSAVTGTSRASSAPLSRAQQTDLSNLSQTAQSSLPWKMRRFDSKTGLQSVQGALRLPVTLARLNRSGRAADAATIRQSLVNLRIALDKAIPLIAQSTNQADFAFAFPDFETNTTNPRIMDQADATSFLAGLYAVRGVLDIALAYDPTYGTFDFNQKIGDRFTAKVAGDTVTPDEYLPPAPFLTLTATGKADFAQAQTDFINGADGANAALTRLAARSPLSGLHLIDSNQITAADYAEGHDGINQFKAALTAPYTTTGNSPVTVNLAAWFSSPPASLRALLPTYTVKEADGFTYLSADINSFPDATFGGIVANYNTDSFKIRFSGDQNVGELATYSGYADYDDSGN